MNIRDHIRKELKTINAEFAQRDGKSGVLFHDESEFIPFDDLNVNREYGYYRISDFPDIDRDCTNENPETLHRGVDFHEWEPIIWADSGGNLNMIGDPWQAADLYQALGEYLKKGTLDPESISEDDWAWDYMKRIDWAISEYRNYTGDARTDDQIGNTIRAAANAGRIHGASKTDAGNWYFNPSRFRGWLVKTKGENRGRPRATVSEMIENFDGNTQGVQHKLAAMTREATGSIPRGQLWQPCEHRGCDNEPVCMNCMMCQEKHCHCFD
jgi:hypothetical protein